MSVYCIHAGHNEMVKGANGYINETDENRKLLGAIFEILESNNNIVYDCTDNYGKNINENITNILNNHKRHKSADLNISIHLNAGIARDNGAEIVVNNHKSSVLYARKILSNIESTGIRDGGIIRDYKNYRLLEKMEYGPAIIIKCCYVTSRVDYDFYDRYAMAGAIAHGIMEVSAFIDDIING